MPTQAWHQRVSKQIEKLDSLAGKQSELADRILGAVRGALTMAGVAIPEPGLQDMRAAVGLYETLAGEVATTSRELHKLLLEG